MLLVWRHKSKVDSSIKQQSKLQNHHKELSFQRLHEGIAPKIVGFYHISGEINTAGILSKHWVMHRYSLCYRHFCSGKTILHIVGIKMENKMLWTWGVIESNWRLTRILITLIASLLLCSLVFCPGSHQRLYSLILLYYYLF